MTRTEPARSLATSQGELAMAKAVAAADREQFAAIMRQYNRRLYRLARSALRDDAEAEDALQDAYLSMSQFRAEASLSTWLSRLVLNECLGRMRRSARRQKVVPIVSWNDEIDTVAGQDAERPDRIFARAEMRKLLENKLDQLPEVFRLVFVLRSVEELSVPETAQSLGIPEATVRSPYFRAKALMREALAQEIDLAERDLFEFGGSQCDRVIARVLDRLNEAAPRQT